MEPSNTAKALQWEQTALREKQINLLFLERDKLKKDLRQNLTDLNHIGANVEEDNEDFETLRQNNAAYVICIASLQSQLSELKKKRRKKKTTSR
jgi:hypothetical protein